VSGLLHDLAREKNLEAAETYKKNTDNNLELFSMISSGLFRETAMENIAYNRSNNIESDYFSIIQKIKAVNSIYANHFTQMFVYVHNSGTVLYQLGKTTQLLFYEKALLTLQYIPESKYEIIIAKTELPKLTFVPDGLRGPYVYHSFTFGYNYLDDQYITIVFQTSLKDFFGVTDPDIIYGIYSQNDTICSDEALTAYVEAPILEKAAGFNFTETELLDKYYYTYVKNDVDGSVYFFVTPKERYQAGLKDYTVVAIASICIFIVAVSILMRYFVKKQSKQMKLLISSLENELNTRERPNFIEYGIIEDYFQRVHVSLIDYKDAIQKSSGPIKNMFLLSLLRNPDVTNDDIADEFELFDINFPTHYFIVAVVKVLDNNAVTIINNGSGGKDFVDSTIKRVFSEILDEYFYLETLFIDGRLACIISTGNDDSGNIKTLEQALFNVLTYLLDTFNISCHVSVSNVNEGISGIHDAYGQALECGGYTHMLRGESVVFYSSVTEIRCKYDNIYSQDMEQKLTSFLKSADRDKVEMLLENLFLDIKAHYSVHPESTKTVCLNLIGTLFKTFEPLKISGSENLVHKMILTLNSDFNENSIDELLRATKKWVDKICSHIETTRFRNDENLIGKINKYVDQNLSNSNINVSSIADYFGLKVSYLSALYSKNTGIGLHRHISKVRIDAAISLLAKCDSNIEALAEMTGFTNVRTFSRAFSAETGMTPGKYRKSITEKGGSPGDKQKNH